MATFRKYAFPNEATYTALPEPQGFAVPLGNIEGAYCVDILWDAEPEPAYLNYTVWPEPIGAHCFAGWEGQYEKDYNNSKQW